MRVLLLSTCNKEVSLLEDEFIEPIKKIIFSKNSYELDIYHLSDNFNLKDYDKVIISGTALKDFSYFDFIDNLSSLKSLDIPTLGICSGAQILATLLGEDLKDSVSIGLIDSYKSGDSSSLSNFVNEKVYTLYSKCLDRSVKGTTLYNGEDALLVERSNFILSMFHPEVRNEKFLEEFLDNS